MWRRERDSNPRGAYTPTRFPGVRLKPLGHPSKSRRNLAVAAGPRKHPDNCRHTLAIAGKSAKLAALTAIKGNALRRSLLAISILLLVVAVVVLFMGLIEHGGWAKPSIASVWAGINANSLIGFGALVEQRIDQSLWLDVVLPFLATWPMWSLPAIVGIILLVIGLLTRSNQCRDGAAQSG